VTHYYSKLGVAEVCPVSPVSVGEEYVIIGETSGAVEGVVTAMHTDDGEKQVAQAGEVFSIKVDQRVRVNDTFYILSPVEPSHAGQS
jgi:putative protease